jgi:asparagine synthetase B (glutamine-hydrolysing)
MPGLVGAIGDRVNPELVVAMRRVITHRDWYQTEDYASPDGGAAISRVHLGIVKGKQPYTGRNGRVQVFLHGEIYSDGAGLDPLEHIYRLYDKHGQDFASFLNGSFAVVILDQDKQIALIANDRIASKPLYYFQDNQAIYFAPEIKSLLLIPSLERKINPAAVADFLANGHLITEHTLIEGIRSMDSASVLQCKRGQVTRHRYWSFEINEEERDRGPEYYRQELAGLLRQAVHRCLQVNGRYGLLLSGGYDSRGILGCYLEEGRNQELETVSWGREEDIPDSDCAVAKRLAQKLGARHGFYRLSGQEVLDNFREFMWLGEGLTDFPEAFEVFHRIRERQKIDIVLRGDECFGYSRWTTVHDDLSMFRALDLRSMRYIGEYQRVLKPGYYRLFSELDAETRRHVSARCNARNVLNRKDFYYLDVRLTHYLNPLNYVKTFALESFRPLLDNDILDWVRVLPVRYRYGKGFWRETVVRLFPHLYKEMAHRHNMIDWVASLKSSPETRRFVYRELIEEQNTFDEFINTEGLKQELDAFFAPSTPAPHATTKTRIMARLESSPVAYHYAHKLSYYAKKWRGRITHDLSAEQLILRLLILKTWGDVFLNSPTATAPE